MKPKSFMFIVQGEGRGHITQAIALHNILKSHQMDLCCVVVGMQRGREIPDFFQSKILSPVVKVESPGFAKDKNKKAIHWSKTIFSNFLKIPSYVRSIMIIHKLVKFHQPDIILNFFEPLSAIYNVCYKPGCKTISIAHQFVYLHKDFKFPDNNLLKRWVLKTYTRFVASGSGRILALSMYPLDQAENEKLKIVPPLIRPDIMDANPTRQDFILAYLVNSGYMENIIHWHEENPNKRIHCFTDSEYVKREKKGQWKYDDTLTFHSLQDTLFIQLMSSCFGIVTSAGFESVCEAMFMSKPVMMVPVEGHFEQFCNASDGQRSGAGIHSADFNISRLINYLPFYNNHSGDFQGWVFQAREMFFQTIKELYPEEFPVAPKNGDIPLLKIV